MSRIIPSVDEANYNHWAWARPDGKYAGPFNNHFLADRARSSNGGGGYLVRCSAVGVLLPAKQPDGTYIDMGDIHNPPVPTIEEKQTMSKKIDEIKHGTLTYTGAGKTGEVLQSSADRISRQEEHMAKFGIKLPPPVFAPGSLTDSGTASEMFHVSHVEHMQKPLVTDTLKAIKEAVQAEKRMDMVLNPATLRMNTDGRIYRENGRRNADGTPVTLALEPNGLRQLCARLPEQFPRAGDFLMALDPKDRAEAFNAQICKADKEMELKTRTRFTGGTDRSVFAFVGKSYAAFDADRIADTLLTPFHQLQAEFGEAGAPRGAGLYRPEDSSLRVDSIWHADTIVDAAAGDVFKVGLRFRSSDSGGGSIKANLVAWRNRCLNFIIIGQGDVEILRRTHRGSIDDVSVDLTAATEKAREFVKGFAEDWGLLRNTSIGKIKLWGEEYDSVPEALKAMVDQGKIDGVTANAVATEALLTAWTQEPGNTLADLVNAVTRYAHSAKLGIERQEKVERSAGDLIPVLVRAASRANA
jgi:hypothetical protein